MKVFELKKILEKCNADDEVVVPLEFFDGVYHGEIVGVNIDDDRYIGKVILIARKPCIIPRTTGRFFI